MLRIADQGVISRETGRGAYMPVITSLPDGTFIACQHVGQGLGSPDNYIEVLRSVDGKVWVGEGRIHTESHDIDKWCYRGPKISTVPDGRLVMTATRFQNLDFLFDLDTEGLAPCELLLFWSADNGRTWSDPQVVPTGLPTDRYTANGAGSLQQLGLDRWMYPFETWMPVGYDGPPDQKAAAVFSSDQGKTWGEFTTIADDESGRILWWDQMGSVLRDGRILTLIWTHLYGTSEDLNNHWTVSEDMGRTWSEPRPTNLRGQVCMPIPLDDGRVAAIYNYRHDQQGIHIAMTEDFSHFDVENELIVFDAGAEATFGLPETEQFMAEHMQIAFGKPGGVLLEDGDIMTYFWCTAQGVTHTRWVRVTVD